MGTLRKFGIIGANPLIVVEMALAVQTLLGGAYLLNFVLSNQKVAAGSAFIQIVASDFGIILFASLFILTGLIIIAGIVKRKVKWRQTGLFWNILTRFYALLTGLIANGLFPPSWLPSATLLFLALYTWRRIKSRGIE